MRSFLVCAALTSVALAATSVRANAGPITAASAVVNAPATIGDYSFDRTIDQSGLSLGYVSGVTDFATYAASGPRHIGSNEPENFAASLAVPPRAVVDYDLGLSQEILQLAFWQYPFASSGPILDFRVFTSDDSAFAVSTNVGTFTALVDGTGNGSPGTGIQVFDLLDTKARYLRIDVLTIDGDGFGWSEVGFETDAAPAVPEPASLLLFGTGLVGLRAWRRRRQ